ncbi:LysR family transcriptional regulator [Ensifer sp. ENS07]|uniref:LysR family transcriptional regulator n=1 Tax=unclassified Ensifer TaxID=2633371 RepID=UPI0017809487|nr:MULTISPECIES: LysR family transcriptional regulator [unclassified Ensifer]MBD9508021.1 LysR family transcriptional regulator [Ensifer sp. ENS10]MBD9637483.1 LysR family transcriptional regulator [Ensifer sp. ENS07]
MNLDLLDTFLDLLETGNFRRTSERLETTQPAVSGRIKTLERAVGAQLFHRGRAGAVPTSAGIRFEKHARAIKAGWAHAQHDIGGLEHYDGPLRISGPLSSIGTLVLDWIEELHIINERLELVLHSGHSSTVMADLSGGRIDIGIVFSPKCLPDLSIEETGVEKFQMVSTEFDRLSDVTSRSYIRARYTTYFERMHTELLPGLTRSAIAVDHEDHAIGILKRRGGTTYLPHQTVETLSGSGMSVRLVEGAPEIKQPVYVVTQRHRRHESLIDTAVDALKSVTPREGL